MPMSLSAFRLLVSTTLLLGLNACSLFQRKDPATLSSTQPQVPSAIAEADIEALFVEGMKHFVLGDYRRANQRFVICDSLQPDRAAVKYQLARCQMMLRLYPQAQLKAEQALRLDDTNPYYYGLLAELCQRNRDYPKSIEVYQALLQKVPGSEEYYYELATAQMATGKLDDALRSFDKVEEHFGFNESVSKQKQRIFLSRDSIDQAIAEGKRLADAFPEYPDYGLEQARLLIQYERWNAAEEHLRDMSSLFPNEPRILLLLADVYRGKGDEIRYRNLLEEAFREPSLEADLKVQVTLSLFEQAKSEQDTNFSLLLAKTTADAHPDHAPASALYGDLLIQTTQYAEARTYYLRSARKDGNNFNVWQRIISLDWELQQQDSMIKHAEEALELFPNNASLYLQLGTAYYVLKRYDRVQETLEQGKVYTNDKQMLIQFDAQLGDTYHYLKKYAQSDEAYEEVLLRDPNNIHVLNNYSYFLSLRKEKLDKALKMGEKLITLEPENSTYLDTYGWILYVAGRYPDALKQLEKAARLLGEQANGTILEHYGDALYKNGQKEKAVEQWQKAKTTGGSENPELLERKIREARLIE